jgi:serine/threonine protein kinase
MDRKLGPYQPGESLGTLPFGELCAATHTARTEPLAALLLDDRLAKDHRFRGLLRLENARAGGLRHPAIARPVEVAEHDGTLFIVFERAPDSQTLARSFAEGDPPAREETVALIRRLAEGLDLAHGRRMVHGAIDPSSILVGTDGAAALLGVGIVGAIEEAGLIAVIDERRERAFIAPEQRDGRRSLASADGYALGVLAASLLRVTPPPAGPADPVGNVLARQCAADPAARFPTCTAFASALAEAISPAAQPAASTASPLVPSAPTEHVRAIPSPAPGQMPRELPDAAPARPGVEAIPPDVRPSPSTATVSAPNPGISISDAAPPSGPPIEAGAPATTPELLQPPLPEPDLSQPAREPGADLRGPAPGEAIVETSAPTPAMLAAIAPPEQRDLIGDAIVWLANQHPDAEELLHQYCPNGKFGPVPLGIAAAGVLALLFLIGAQVFVAVAVLMTAVVVHYVPRFGAILTASERASVQVTRVTGMARLQRTPDSVGPDVPRLTLANGIALSLRHEDYELLSRFGWPATVQRPVPGVSGVQDVVAWYDLPGVTVAYLWPGGLLLDVRGPDGAVLHRRAPYEGEPGDRVLSADLPPSQPTGPTQPPSVLDPSAPPPQAPAPTSPLQPDPGRVRASVSVVAMPPTARTAMQAAAKSAGIKAGLLIGAGLLLLAFVSYVFSGFGFFWVIFVIAMVVGNFSTVARTFKLWQARTATTLTRVEGPATLTYHSRRKKGSLYRLILENGDVLTIDAAIHTRLTDDGEAVVTPDAWGFSFSRYSNDGYLQSEHRLPSVTVTYEPATLYLLEIVSPAGGTLYRDPALHEGDLGTAAPSV